MRSIEGRRFRIDDLRPMIYNMYTMVTPNRLNRSFIPYMASFDSHLCKYSSGIRLPKSPSGNVRGHPPVEAADVVVRVDEKTPRTFLP